jgi:hypothetical protein
MQIYRPSPRAWAAIGVLAAWGASLAWLGVRRLTQTESATISAEAALRLAPGAAWFAVYSGDVPVGQAGITLDTLSPGYQILETFALETPQDAMVLRSSRATVTKLTAALQVTEITDRSTRGGWSEQWQATVAGGRFRLGVIGDSTPVGVALPATPTTLAVVPYRLALSGGLGEGRQRVLPGYAGWPGALLSFSLRAGRDSMAVFADSSAMDPATGELLVAHRDSALARAVIISGDGPAERWWIDSRGRVVGVESAFGVRWVRTDFDLVTRMLRNRGPERVEALRQWYPAIRVLTRPASGRTAQRFVLSRRDGKPLDPELLAPLAAGRQELRGDTLIIHDEGAYAGAADQEAARRDPLDGEAVAGVEAIVTRVRAALGSRATDETAWIDALAKDVAARVTLDTASASPVSAAKALATGRARADGIARLFVAAAEAAGLRARLAIGLRPVGDGFESHAWAEVRVNDRWRSVDPAFGRANASTDLIRLSRGGSSSPWRLLPQVAQLRIIAVPTPEEVP